MSKLAVIGARESGTWSAVLAADKGHDVFVSDSGKIESKYKDILLRHQLPFEEERHSKEKILQADLVVKSPGVPETGEVLVAARKKGIPVMSEIAFAMSFSKGRFIGISGSNGKTTTTLLTHHILDKGGIDVGLAGNVGSSLAHELVLADHKWFVLELSSFQLDGMQDVNLDIAILLNITPDHLDRYDYKFENYAASKMAICRNQKSSDYFIYNHDDPCILKSLERSEMTQQCYPFSIREQLEQGAYCTEGQINFIINHKPSTMNIQELALQGKHNLYNSMAAGIAGRVLELRKELIRESLGDFQNIEHRLEFVLTVCGIDFINDSKATNVNSVWYALDSIDKPVIWIAGGVDKGNDYDELMPLVREKVKALVCLSKKTPRKLIRTFGEVVPTVETDTMTKAVQACYSIGKKGDVVLLSPACASFDLFGNYEERGRQFKEAVRNL